MLQSCSTAKRDDIDKILLVQSPAYTDRLGHELQLMQNTAGVSDVFAC